MYTKSRGITDAVDTAVSVPPGYDGSRFRKSESGEYKPVVPSVTADTVDGADGEVHEKNDGALQFLKNIGKEELLIIALIIILSGEKQIEGETVLMLALLLCAH